MQLTLADITSRATTLAGGRRDWAVSEVSFWANQAAVEVYQQVYHTPLEALAVSSTTSGEQRVSLPSDFEGMIALSNLSLTVQGTGRQLDAWEAPRMDSNATPLGTPIAYATYADYLELWPTPDSAYSLQLRYYAKQPILMDSTATPRFDERWHIGWLYKTAELLELSRNNYEGAAVMGQRYTSYMNSIPSDRARRQMAKDGMALRFQREAE